MALVKQDLIQPDPSEYETWNAPLVEGPITSKMNDVPPKPPTAGQIQSLQKEAYGEAYEMGRKEGREQGYNDGYKEGEYKLHEKVQLFEHILDIFSEPIKQLDDEVEQNLVELAIQIARHLVRRELKYEPGEIVAVVREALSALPVSDRKPRIFLHPEDAVLVRSALSLNEEDQNWHIDEDILMMRGDCRVETESSLIDASVEARLSAVAARLLGGERDSDADSRDE